MSDSQRVALVQMPACAGDVDGNAHESGAAIAAAADAGAAIVVLPELVASGYVPQRDVLWPVAESVRHPGPCLKAWMTAARDHKVTVIGGFPERDGEHLFNSAAVIDPHGHIASVYRKLHLFGPEWECFTPGDQGLQVVEVGGLAIGVLVCYDLRFPEALRILALKGAQLIAVPTAWVGGFDKEVAPDDRIGQVDGAIVQANLSQVFVGCADQVGRTAEHAFLGRSVAVDPFGQVIGAIASPTEPQTLMFEVDPGMVERARHRGPGIDPFDNRRTDVYGDFLGYQEVRTEEAEG